MATQSVFLEMSGVFHTYYRTILKNSPDGYEFTGSDFHVWKMFERSGNLGKISVGSFPMRIFPASYFELLREQLLEFPMNVIR